MGRKMRIASVTFAAIAVMLSLALTGCGGGGPKVLKVWHYESGNGAMGAAWDDAMKKFEASHPGVKVQFESKGFEQIRQTASMILNSDEAPDVMEYNKGNATAGLLSKQGLLTDITSVAKSRGWDKILGPSLASVCQYDENGIMGSGKWYGVTDYGEFVMVYYNKDMFAKYGQKVPASLAELESVMDAFVKNKVTPLAVAGAEYPAQQIFYELVLSKADRAFINAYQLYKGEVDFNGPQFTFGADTMVQWMKKGYISKAAVGMKAEDMGLAFEGGKSPMMISGSWWFGRLMTEIKNFDWGMFLFPGNTYAPGSGGNIWVVPSKSKAKQLAYDFIDITLQKDNQTLLGNKGGIPVNADLDKITDLKVKELIQNFSALVKGDGLAFYPDWPAPGYYDVLVSNVQDLMNGTKDPAKFLESIAAAYKQR
jgi:raffinose/stachyose/melibiose transport system substrate-binding protein